MNCARSNDLIDLCVARELDADLARDVEHHAAHCPVCAQRLAASRSLITTLDTTLDRFRAADDFAERTMARVARDIGSLSAREPQPESLRSRFLRYSALAAACLLFALAGHRLFARRPLGRLRGGQAKLGRAHRADKTIQPGASLDCGDTIETPENGEAVVDLAGGRMRAVLKRNTIVRICDPRRGAVAHVEQGDFFCRVASDEGSPVIVSPLGRIGTTHGAISVHVAPARTSGPAAGRFRGSVTLAAHEGGARVLLPGGRSALTLRPGQVITLSTDPGPSLDRILALEEGGRQLERYRALVRAKQAELRTCAHVQHDPTQRLHELEGLKRHCRQLILIQRCRTEGQRVFRAELASFER